MSLSSGVRAAPAQIRAGRRSSSRGRAGSHQASHVVAPTSVRMTRSRTAALAAANETATSAVGSAPSEAISSGVQSTQSNTQGGDGDSISNSQTTPSNSAINSAIHSRPVPSYGENVIGRQSSAFVVSSGEVGNSLDLSRPRYKRTVTFVEPSSDSNDSAQPASKDQVATISQCSDEDTDDQSPRPVGKRRVTILEPSSDSNDSAQPASKHQVATVGPSSGPIDSGVTFGHQNPQARLGTKRSWWDLANSKKADDGDQDTSDFSTPPARHPVRVRLDKRLSERQRLQTQGLDPASYMNTVMDDAPLQARLSQATNMIWHNYDGFNKNKVQQALRGMNLETCKLLAAPARQGITGSLDMLLSLSQVRELKLRVENFKSLKPELNNRPLQWCFLVLDPSSPHARCFLKEPTSLLADDAELVRVECEKILNRWPVSLDLILRKPALVCPVASRMIFEALKIKLFPIRPVECLLPT